MAWIELHQSLFTHRKTFQMSDALDLPEVYVVAHLAALWTWALDNAPDGVLPESRRIIAKAAQWTGDAQTFVTALIDAGFLRTEEGRTVIHDWDGYAGKLIDRRRRNAESMKAARGGRATLPPVDEESHIETTCLTRGEHVSGECKPTQPNPTVPNPTQQNQSEDPPDPPEGAGRDAVASFAELFKAKFGENPDIPPRHAKQLKDLILRVKQPTFEKALQGFFGDPWPSESGYSVSIFLSQPMDRWTRQARASPSPRQLNGSRETVPDGANALLTAAQIEANRVRENEAVPKDGTARRH